jgi:hypothetical protein
LRPHATAPKIAGEQRLREEGYGGGITILRDFRFDEVLIALNASRLAVKPLADDGGAQFVGGGLQGADIINGEDQKAL